jgi:3'(2'), 5'-bisphosphate nucleotidase
MTYTPEKELAIAAVTLAAALCAAVRAEMVGADSLQKEDKSPVTIADFGAQALVCQLLKAAFPCDPVVGEEDSADLRQPANATKLAQILDYVRRWHPKATAAQVCEWIDAGNGQIGPRFWTLDPIDGTKGFLRDDQYAIALALIEGGEVQVGALACPALPFNLTEPDGTKGTLFVAVRGQGAEMTALNGTLPLMPIQVAATATRFVESVEAAHGNHALQEAVAQAVGVTQPPLRLDSQAKYGTVARGDAALYLRLPSTSHPHYRENIWDHAAGALLVEEAGGCVTDMHGQPLDFGTNVKMHANQGVVVSNGSMHAQVITTLTQY